MDREKALLSLGELGDILYSFDQAGTASESIFTKEEIEATELAIETGQTGSDAVTHLLLTDKLIIAVKHQGDSIGIHRFSRNIKSVDKKLKAVRPYPQNQDYLKSYETIEITIKVGSGDQITINRPFNKDSKQSYDQLIKLIEGDLKRMAT